MLLDDASLVEAPPLDISLVGSLAADSDVTSVDTTVDVGDELGAEDVVSTTALDDDVAMVEDAAEGVAPVVVAVVLLAGDGGVDVTPEVEAVEEMTDEDESLVVSLGPLWSPQPARKAIHTPAALHTVRHSRKDLYIDSQVGELGLRFRDASPKVAQISAEDVRNREQHLRQDAVLITKVLIAFDDSPRLTCE